MNENKISTNLYLRDAHSDKKYKYSKRSGLRKTTKIWYRKLVGKIEKKYWIEYLVVDSIRFPKMDMEKSKE